MIVTANEYLDARRPDWLDAETLGRVRYDPVLRVVTVAASCPEIEKALSAVVIADPMIPRPR